MQQFASLIILLAYASLAAELIFLHVPSVASVYQLVFSKKSLVNFNKCPLPSGKLKAVMQWPLVVKILLLVVPTFICILTGLLPIIFIALLFLNKINWHQLNNHYIMQNTVGCILIMAGRFLTIYCTLIIRKNNKQQYHSFDLKTNDIFSFSRNPLLLGMYLMYAGTWVIFPTFFFALGLIIYLANMHFRILLEEDFLAHQFGEHFINYKQKTRRYC